MKTKIKLDLQYFSEASLSESQTSDSPLTEDSPDSVLTEQTEEAVCEADGEAPEKTAESPLSEEMIQRIYGHIAKLEEETKGLKEIFPDFDLYRELKNPTFARLTAPESGIHAEDAYYAVHRKELQTMFTEAQKPSEQPKPPMTRPNENGLSAKAPSVMAFDYRNASKQHREALKKAIRAAAAKGEKIYPK